MKGLLLLFVLAVTLYQCEGESQSANTKFLYFTVASKETDGFRRFKRSVAAQGIDVQVLGLGEKWQGGDMNYPGGGYKLNLLRPEIMKHKDDKDLVIMFSDSYDVMVTGTAAEILRRFKALKGDIVFSAESYCWPDKNLEDEYPIVLHGYRFLNSGAFMGYAHKLAELLSEPLGDKDDDQLYLTKKFLDDKFRFSLNMKLDTQAKIFMSLNGNNEDVSLDLENEKPRLTNTVYHSNPIVIHANGPTKNILNSLGNYFSQKWTGAEKPIDLSARKKADYPKVLIGFFATQPTPFIEEALQRISDLNYPKKKIYIYIYNNNPSLETTIQAWIEKQKDEKYNGLKYVSSLDTMKSWHARVQAIDRCLEIECDVYFNVDSEVHLDNPEALSLLISYNRPVIAPIITQIGKLWSTFWGDVTDAGYYARSNDYMDIVNNKKVGIWNVPYIYGAYVIWRSVLEDPETKPNYVKKLDDPDIALTGNFRMNGVFMYAVNLDTYGHLVNNEAVSQKNLHNDLWQVAANPQDWEEKYLHSDYYEVLDPDYQIKMPCTDVYWYPVFTERFTKDLIETMEHFGEWSGGKNDDIRLTGGYENVPTDDIHMNQIGYEQEWLFILKKYIKPMAEKVYIGYTSEATAIMNFVVRYKPTKQSFLRPHHDSSTYTINVSLNRYMVDYEGGGSNFIRQKCSVQETKVGWAIMHPGRLTHYHEGLPTTKGTRYIMVSFIDP